MYIKIICPSKYSVLLPPCRCLVHIWSPEYGPEEVQYLEDELYRAADHHLSTDMPKERFTNALAGTDWFKIIGRQGTYHPITERC